VGWGCDGCGARASARVARRARVAPRRWIGVAPSLCATTASHGFRPGRCMTVSSVGDAPPPPPRPALPRSCLNPPRPVQVPALSAVVTSWPEPVGRIAAGVLDMVSRETLSPGWCFRRCRTVWLPHRVIPQAFAVLVLCFLWLVRACPAPPPGALRPPPTLALQPPIRGLPTADPGGAAHGAGRARCRHPGCR
jgi:hypothetical protein